MVADVINFPIKKAVVPTPEEVEAEKLQEIEDCIDKNIRNFISLQVGFFKFLFICYKVYIMIYRSLQMKLFALMKKQESKL